MAKAPSLQFYPGDVQRDTALCAVSLPAYGLWHRMLWVMFDGTPYGHLSVNGSVIPPVNLARLLRVTEQELETLTAELEAAGVLSRTDEGVIYSRRMVRDAKRRETNALNGGKGGNPELTGKKPRLSKSVNRKDNPKDNPLTADAIAYSNSTSGKERAKEELPEGFKEFWAAYDYSKKKPDAIKAWARLSAEDRAACMAKVPAFVQSKPDKQFRPYPASFLNGRMWEDEIIFPLFSTANPIPHKLPAATGWITDVKKTA